MNIILEAQARSRKEKLNADFLPAVIYGKGVAAQSLKIKKAELEKTVKVAGESNLITLKIGSDSKNVMIKDVAKDGISGKVIHTDFFEVNMKNKIQTEIPLHFIGESRVIKELAGLIIKDLNFLEIECLPNALVDHIDIDISVLREFHDQITTEDLVLPAGMTLVNTASQIIVSAIPPRIIVEEVIEENVADKDKDVKGAKVATDEKSESKNEKK